jgi:hypothetical protein
MFTGLAQLFRASILFLGAALLMATYLLPSYPTPSSLAFRPACFVALSHHATCAQSLQRALPLRSWSPRQSDFSLSLE